MNCFCCFYMGENPVSEGAKSAVQNPATPFEEIFGEL
jgi:hypothetical protein